jgi:hypothetical protein
MKFNSLKSALAGGLVSTILFLTSCGTNDRITGPQIRDENNAPETKIEEYWVRESDFYIKVGGKDKDDEKISGFNISFDGKKPEFYQIPSLPGLEECTLEHLRSDLSDGTHSISISAVDERGKSDDTPECLIFNTPNKIPETKLTNFYVNGDTISFSGEGIDEDNNVHLQYAFYSHTNPEYSNNRWIDHLEDKINKSFSGLPSGIYNLELRAIDEYGAIDETPENRFNIEINPNLIYLDSFNIPNEGNEGNILGATIGKNNELVTISSKIGDEDNKNQIRIRVHSDQDPSIFQTYDVNLLYNDVVIPRESYGIAFDGDNYLIYGEDTTDPYNPRYFFNFINSDFENIGTRDCNPNNEVDRTNHQICSGKPSVFYFQNNSSKSVMGLTPSDCYYPGDGISSVSFEGVSGLHYKDGNLYSISNFSGDVQKLYRYSSYSEPSPSKEFELDLGEEKATGLAINGKFVYFPTNENNIHKYYLIE